MAEYVYKKNDAGIRKLLQSDGCLKVMENYARKRSESGKIRPFIGFDRAKVFIEVKKQ